MISNHRSNLFINLSIIYLALVFLVGIAIYALIKHYALDAPLATNILIWSATLFAPIAILATLNSWKEQKSSEILAAHSKEMYAYMSDTFTLIDDIMVHMPRTLEQSQKYYLDLSDNHNKNCYMLYIYIDMIKRCNDEEFLEIIEDYQKNHIYYMYLIDCVESDITSNNIRSYISQFEPTYNELHKNIKDIKSYLIDYILHRR